MTNFDIINHNLVSAEFKRPVIELNKPVYIAATILDLSKLHMFTFYYNTIKRIWPHSKLCYTDTDSFLLMVKCSDVYEDIKNNLDQFDTSNYPKSHKCYSDKNKGISGVFKDEMGGKLIRSVVALRPKSYSILAEDSEVKKAKGVGKTAIARLCFKDYQSVIRNQTIVKTTNKRIVSKFHKVYFKTETKSSLSCVCDKRYWVSPIKSRSFGHYKNTAPAQ